MLDFVTETQTVWERMAQAGKPVVLYGMGDGADKILNICREKGISVADVFASDDHVRGHFFQGYPVLRYTQVKEKYRDFLVVIAFATEKEAVLQRIYEIANEAETVAPHVPLFSEPLFTMDFLTENKEHLEQVYHMLADNQSRRVFSDVLNFRISGKLKYLWASTTDRREDYQEILRLGRQESYVDLGAYRGDTVQEFLEMTNGCYQRIVALEPDAKNFLKLQETIRAYGLKNVLLKNMGAWDKEDMLPFQGKAGRNSTFSFSGKACVPVDSVDHILNGAAATFIKMDVEGAETPALLGCRETIARWRPKLFVSAYHYDRDLFALPLLIRQLCPEYHIYLRRHPYIPAWETNYFAVAG